LHSASGHQPIQLLVGEVELPGVVNTQGLDQAVQQPTQRGQGETETDEILHRITIKNMQKLGSDSK
jgi:hypothetical protein